VKKKRFELRLTEKQDRALGEIAEQLEMSKAEVLRSLIDAIEVTSEERERRAKEIIRSAYQRALQDADWLSSDDAQREYTRESFEVTGVDATERDWEKHLEFGLAIEFAKVIDRHAISITKIINKVEEQLKSL